MIVMKEPTTQFSHVREDFPILQGTNRNKPLVYLDSASSAQKPKAVINAISNFYSNDYANIHRGIYELSERASFLHDQSRSLVKEFINASQTEEIVFTSGTTESINLVAQSFGKSHFKSGDEVIISGMEHHSNIVPWYLLKQQLGIKLKVIPVTDEGVLDLSTYKSLFSERTKLVALSHASNVLGTINPIKEMIEWAHQHHVPVLIDGAQAAPHMAVDIKALNCDFYAFSSHKLYGPSGVGVLYGKKELLDAMHPYQGGGGMIETVSFANVTFAPTPQKFEAGTPDMAGIVGLGAALQYVSSLGINNIFNHEQTLRQYTETKLSEISGLRIIGTPKHKLGVISFVLDNIHPHDIGTILDHEGIAIRAGHHCAMPLMDRFAVPAMVRVSLGVYNNENDINKLIAAIHLAKRLLG